MNPFAEKPGDDSTNIELIKQTLQGDKTSLEKLVLRHQAWIYNIAFRMVLNRHDAEDVTQEVLIKIITKLSTYNPVKGGFRTWVYKIASNHILNMKMRKFEKAIIGFEEYGKALDEIPDEKIPESLDKEILIEECKISCITGMLLCLNREHRMIYVLGEIFSIDDKTGNEILGISRENFRQRLSRARKKLYYFLNGKCGLINSANPCRCKNKASGFIRNHWVNPDSFEFYENGSKQITAIVKEIEKNFEEEFYEPYNDLFRANPFYDTEEMRATCSGWLKGMIEKHEFKDLFMLQ